MAYDEQLAERIRELINADHLTTEKKMFGGLAFLIGGNMAVSASGQGGILVRVDPKDTDNLLDSTPAELMTMGGRSMTGWLRVGPEHLAGDTELAQWVRRGATYAASLPAKTG